MINKNQKGGYKSQLHGMSQKKHLHLIFDLFYPPPPFINVIKNQDRLFIRDAIFKKGSRVLDIGSGISKGPGSWLWEECYNSGVEIIRLDIVSGPNIDYVADATDLPEDIGQFDAVILQSVPEHVKEIQKLFSEAIRVLKVGGYIYVEMPFLQGVHGDPSDYWRTTLDGLQELVYPCNVIKAGVSGGPIGAIVWIFSDFISNITKWNSLNFFLRFFSRWIFSPLRYFDILLRSTKSANRLASENFCLARKCY
jgi:SAM-dependent methyltransferase